LKVADSKLAEENVRGRSRVRFYRAEWYRVSGKLSEAEQELRNSRALAEQSACPDLVARCRIGQGHLFLERNDLKQALGEYQDAIEVMRDKGVHSLVADGLCGWAAVANRLGDAETARRRAIESLSLASEGLLGLRITDALVVLGVATVGCGLRSLGLAYLKRAIKLGDLQGYSTRKSEAEREFRRLSGA
jgi:tetratricopeptide (TPR) repeat protein